MSEPADADPTAAVIAAVTARFDQLDLRLFDEVPENATYPYTALGLVQVIPDDDGCLDGSEVYVDLHIWSEVRSRTEVSAIAGRIRTGLRTDLAVAGHHVIVQELEGIQHVPDPSEQLTHATLTLRLELEPA